MIKREEIITNKNELKKGNKTTSNVNIEININKDIDSKIKLEGSLDITKEHKTTENSKEDIIK